MRDKTNEAKLAPLKKAFGELFNKIELVEADLLKPDTLANAIKGCDYVVHVASPLPFIDPKDENDLIRPALEGTLAVLQAARDHKVKRVVITSSCLTIFRHKPQNMKPAFDENDWSDVSILHPYEKSKTVTEKAAWDFHASLPENDRFELVSVLPSLVMGPSLVTGDFSSGKYLQMIMAGGPMPLINMPIVDVRDVAKAHLLAIKVEGAKNQRFVCCNRGVWFTEMA